MSVERRGDCVWKAGLPFLWVWVRCRSASEAQGIWKAIGGHIFRRDLSRRVLGLPLLPTDGVWVDFHHHGGCGLLGTWMPIGRQVGVADQICRPLLGGGWWEALCLASEAETVEQEADYEWNHLLDF